MVGLIKGLNMRKYIILLAVFLASVSCSKKKDPTPSFDISGKEYSARWRINNQGRQEYVHLGFGSNGIATLWTSVEKVLKYGDEKLNYTRDGNSYFIRGTLKENYYKPVGTKIDWSITPTIPANGIKSTFEFYELHFIAD
jgi:hypothetical protein